MENRVKEYLENQERKMSEFNQKQYVNNYNKENYDKITLRVKKGYKERITKLAESKNMSMSALLVYLVEKEFESERKENERDF